MDRRFNHRLSARDYRIKRGVVTKQDGLSLTHLATATFDTAGVDSSGVSNKTQAAHGLGVYLPDNAIVINAWYDVLTTFVSADDDASIAIHAEAANDLLTATTITNTTPGIFDGNFPIGSPTGIHTTTNVGIIAGFVKTTAEREITATVGTEVLTAGKLIFYTEYVLSD